MNLEGRKIAAELADESSVCLRFLLIATTLKTSSRTVFTCVYIVTLRTLSHGAAYSLTVGVYCAHTCALDSPPIYHIDYASCGQ